MFTAPILLTALAGPLLGERVGWRRWTAVLVGFAGVLVVIRPGGGGYGAEALLPLAAACCIAGRDLLVRRLPTGLDNRTVVLATTLALLAYGALASLVAWEPVTRELLLGATAGAVTVTAAEAQSTQPCKAEDCSVFDMVACDPKRLHCRPDIAVVDF